MVSVLFTRPARQTDLAAAYPHHTWQHLAPVSSCTSSFWWKHSLCPLSGVYISPLSLKVQYKYLISLLNSLLSQHGKNIFSIHLWTGVTMSRNSAGTHFWCFLFFTEMVMSVFYEICFMCMISFNLLKNLVTQVTFFSLIHLRSCPSRGHNHHPRPES